MLYLPQKVVYKIVEGDATADRWLVVPLWLLDGTES